MSCRNAVGSTCQGAGAAPPVAPKDPNPEPQRHELPEHKAPNLAGPALAVSNPARLEMGEVPLDLAIRNAMAAGPREARCMTAALRASNRMSYTFKI